MTLTNTTGHALDHAPYVTLTTQEALSATSEDEGAEPALEIADAERVPPTGGDGDSDSDSDSRVARGASTVSEFVVTPHGKLPPTITFLASAVENDGLGPYGAGAMDAVTFDVVEAAKPSVASK